MIENVFVIDGSPDNWEECLKLTYQKLLSEGCVKESFLTGCIEREKVFPTGLETEIPVAIPHTDAIHVISPAVCLLRLEKPVSFARMDDETESVEAEFVFNMALSNDVDQITMLQRIIEVAQNKEFLLKAKNAPVEELMKELHKIWIEDLQGVYA